ncbi:MAG: EAL domain-containing protein [Woeseiaceae bacterium]|nr:EAL domain-containing protein [Woeseiaceae bacterium]
MPDTGHKSLSILPDDGLDLTRSIRKLSIPTAPANDLDDAVAGTALLVCRDSDSKKWGPRWLSRHGLNATILPDADDPLAAARSKRPDVIIVDSALRAAGGEPVYQSLLDAADLDAPVVVMCATARELPTVLRAKPFDVIRKPFEWELIARRAEYAARLSVLQRRFAESRESLRKAVDIADAARERLRSRESFEPVTGLPNRKKFVDLLKRGMAAVDRDRNQLAVIVIGFSRFRLVIEAMGQERADLMLTQVGNMLADIVSDAGAAPATPTGMRTAAVASIDQSRFAVMITASRESDPVDSMLQRLLSELARPIQADGQTVSLSACLGVAIYPHDADDADSLLQRADNAMRDAQSRGGGFKYYCAETDAAAARKLMLENMLHEAVDRNELTLAYQPITDVGLGRVIAAEALLRWKQPDGTLISPGEFVPVAEESGLMIRIGEFVLDEACKQMLAWHEAGILLPTICVNVSKVQLMSGDFVATVKRIINKHQIDPASVELEISERGVLSGNHEVISQLHDLKGFGVRLSVDDFGTGDSAIAYLKELPIDVLKIDRSYVAGLASNEKDSALVSAMIALGQRLGLAVVAEGVETPDQLAALRNLECDAFQGFLISEPVPGHAFSSLLSTPPNSTD